MALTFANKITICRILAVPFFIGTILYYSPEHRELWYVSFGIFMFAVISDMIDGYIARTRHQKTKAGAILDPLADKMLLIAAFICLYKMRAFFGSIQFPMWFVVVMISRDAILLLGAMIIYLVHDDLNIEATNWGKVAAFFQIFSVIGIFLQWSFSPIFWYLAVIFTCISGIGYIRKGIKVLNNGSGV